MNLTHATSELEECRAQLRVLEVPIRVRVRLSVRLRLVMLKVRVRGRIPIHKSRTEPAHRNGVL